MKNGTAGGGLLAVDVGNTNTVLGLFEGTTLVRHWRLTTRRDATSDEIALTAQGLLASGGRASDPPGDVIVASVVPSLKFPLRQALRQITGHEPVFVEPGIRTGMPILYDTPQEVGADRIVNAVAAYEKFGRTAGRAPRPMVVVDFGTATTLDAVSAKGEYLGGAICPGVQISADALFQRAARLPRIDVRKPPSVIGQTTVGAMESGLFYGYVGMVEGLVRRMTDELGGDVICVATGGLADVIAPETALIQHVDPDLTLDGLRIVWERNNART